MPGNGVFERFLLLERRCACGMFSLSYSIGNMPSTREDRVPKRKEQMKYHKKTVIGPNPGM
jgi:hypothetical protein